jgi:luciferase-like monooxygenase
MTTIHELPRRAGTRPRTTPTNPHTQLDQQPGDARLPGELARRIFAIPGVVEQPSGISVPGARALVLAPGEPTGPPEAFLIGREFAHLHPAPDHSAHAMLPPKLVDETVTAGWGEPHPAARAGVIPPTAVMLYAPRDEDELSVIETLIRASRTFAGGG